MIGICEKCGNYGWDKEVEGDKITCPRCGASWKFKKLPLFILTGCSGIGKTTTAQHIQKECQDIVTLDADMFYNLMPSETDEDGYAQVEQIGSLTKNIAQSGKPVLWTMAGNLDKINGTYNRRFFSDVYVLALIASKEDVQKRMSEGRFITDQNWIQGSVDYNNYFRTHNSLGDISFETCNTEGKSVPEVAEEVKKWMFSKI